MDLPNNILLYVLLLIALALGYVIGRRERRGKRKETAIRDYYQGLNFLLSDRPNLGVDEFIRAAEVSDQTIDVHLAMAGVVRRRGEMDKAIRIHQNLLASPVLSNANKQLVEMELARDYHAAGLLDRAERLLLTISERKSAHQKDAAELLLDLYEQERDWEQAIAVSSNLVRSSSEIRQRVGHFHCELAQNHLDAQDLKSAKREVNRAIELAPTEARGHWLLAQLEHKQRRFKRALKHLRKAHELQSNLTPALLPLYRQCCEQLSDETEYERFLRDVVRATPDPVSLRALMEHLKSQGRPVDPDEFIDEISRAPEIAHLPMLLEFAETESTEPIKRQVRKVVSEEPSYQCRNCGFTSHGLMWHCPTCKAWGSFGTPTRS